MATGGKDINSSVDEAFDLLCTMCKMCKSKGKNNEADIYCTDCQDYYCSICVKVHSQSQTGHQTVDKVKFTKGFKKQSHMIPTEICEKHSGLKPVDMHCPNHDEDGCSTNIAITHRLCQKMSNIPEFVKTSASTADSHDSGQAMDRNNLLQLKGMKKYSTQDKSDTRNCNYTSSLFLNDGTVILVDRGNLKLKRLDTSTYSIRDSLYLRGQPWQVCAVEDEVVAVSYQQREIMFIYVDRTMRQKSLMRTECESYGLAYASGKLFISDAKSFVYIYKLPGTKLSQLSFDPPSGYCCMHCLAVSDNGSKIYVTDYHNGLTVMDNEGQVVGQSTVPALRETHDVHLLSNGTVLVSGWNSNYVMQFGHDAELIGQLLTYHGEDNGCQTVCCNQQMSTMILAGQTNEIVVYDIT